MSLRTRSAWSAQAMLRPEKAGAWLPHSKGQRHKS
jgi:hypothetical protein